MKTNKIIPIREQIKTSKPSSKVDKNITSSKNKVISLQEKKEKLDFGKTGRKLTTSERNKIILEYIPLIRCVARKISSRLPANIDDEDLISNGVMGLMDAIEKYDSDRNNKFRTYAEFRVRGAILDALRSQDWIPRSVRDKTKTINRVTKELEQKYSRAPKSKEIAKALNVSIEKYHEMVNSTNKVNMISIDETSFLNKTDKVSVLTLLENKHSSFNIINRKSIQKIITNSIKELPERQRIVLSLYYYEEFNLRKIGQVLKVTESRVSQLHAQAIERLKTKLASQIEKEELKAAS